MHIQSRLTVTPIIETSHTSQCRTKSLNTTSVLTPPLAGPPQVAEAALSRPLPPSRPRSPSPPRRTAAPPTASAARRARRAPAAARRSPGGWDPEHRRRPRKAGSSRSAPNASFKGREIFSGLWREGRSRLWDTRTNRKHFQFVPLLYSLRTPNNTAELDAREQEVAPRAAPRAARRRRWFKTGSKATTITTRTTDVLDGFPQTL